MEQNRRSLRSHDTCIQTEALTQKSANESKMGSKTQTKENTCDVCDLKFHTVQALRTHKHYKHQSEMKRDNSASTRPKVTPKNTLAAAATSRVSKRLQLLVKDRVIDTESENSEDQNMEEKQNKIEFSCPKCYKMFPIYFQALKHIEKKHSEAEDGSTDSLEIKPMLVETCSTCKKHVDSSHNCNSSTEDVQYAHNNILYCLGCEESFKNVALFSKHASTTHHNELDSMLFNTIEEFNMWKQIMENQVNVKYLALNDSSSQKFYQCNYVSPKNSSSKTYMCPSFIELKELGNGLQIYYCKEHQGHKAPEYEIPEKFRQYLNKNKESKSECIDEFDVLISKDTDDDLYLKFKDLMANISSYAERVSISHLRKLFNSALEMQGLLNSYDEDHDDKDALFITKSMTDDQITYALEGKRSSARLKRKSETRISVDAKKKKGDKSDDDMNFKSKKDEFGKSVSKENKELHSPKLKARASPTLLSPTFNDTYKQFIGDPLLEPKKKSKTNKSKEIVKTKIGQFSPKQKLAVQETVENSTPNILKPSKLITSFGKYVKYEVREQENDCNILILKI